MKQGIRKFGSSIHFMIKYCKKINPSIFGATAIEAILSAVSMILLVTIPRYIIDDLVGKSTWDKIVLDIIVITAAIFGVQLIQKALSPWVGKAINGSDVKTALEYNRLFADTDYENQKSSVIRDLCKKLMFNVHVNGFAYMTLGDFLKNLLMAVAFSILVLNLDVFVFFIAFIASIAAYCIDVKRKKQKYEFDQDSAAIKRKMDYLSSVLLNFQYAKEIRLGRAANGFHKKYHDVIGDYEKISAVFTRKKIALNVLESFFSAVMQLVAYGYAALLALRGRITVGEFVMYVGVLLTFFEAVKKTIAGISALHYYSVYVDDYQKFKKELMPKQRESQERLQICKERSYEIVFENVSFTYPGTDKKVLDHVNIQIKPGEKLAVVGRNGAGKSTFIKLLCRLYYPTEGRILVNGEDAASFSNDEYRKLVAVVFQDYKLFSFSVSDNIILAQAYDEGKLQDSLVKSGFAQKAADMPNGLDTNISKDFDENGMELSGGEAQRLVQARAIYKDAPIVILDEPTAAIDALAERKMYESFNRMTGNKTAIYISHRLSSGKFCDRILVFDDGKIVAQGKHENLIEEHGIYEEMFSKQAIFYAEKTAGNIVL